jgi:aspartate carbamoyltransferase catalytic subunit
MKHIISISQFKDKKQLISLFDRAIEFSNMPAADYPKPLQHMTVASIFFEPSTRTRLSFETAIQNLGANLITVENADASSAKKGETLEDTTRMLNGYAEAVVMRHPEVGSAERAAAVSQIPIINAGDGAGEHPTQALLDGATIHKHRGSLEGLKVGLVGDLLNGRTIHSLVQLLSVFGAEFYCMSPTQLALPKKYKDIVEKNGSKIHEFNQWDDDALAQVDVLYMTRVQKERFKLVEDYMAVKDDFILDADVMKKFNKEGIVMHPLPRVNEIATEVDDDPRAMYFEQARIGLYTRMALLEMLFKD